MCGADGYFFAGAFFAAGLLEPGFFSAFSAAASLCGSHLAGLAGLGLSSLSSVSLAFAPPLAFVGTGSCDWLTAASVEGSPASAGLSPPA